MLEVLKVINELTDKDFKMYLAAGLIAVNEKYVTNVADYIYRFS